MASTSGEESQSTSEGTSNTSDSTKVAKFLQSTVDDNQTVVPNQASRKFDGQRGPFSPPDLSAADDLMERGSRAFKGHNFAEAADCYRRVLAIKGEFNAQLDAQCSHIYYKYGLALLYQVPIPIEGDLMAVVPKEADYPLQFDDNGNLIHGDRDPDGGVKGGGGSKNLVSAWDVLKSAWSIVENQQGDSLEKVDILSAQGEVAFRSGDVLTSKEYYLKALPILERLVEPDHQRIAHLNFKVSVCLRSCSKIEEAITYCEKALLVCKTRLKRFIGEVYSPSTFAATLTASELNQESSSVHHVDHSSILQKKAETRMLTGLSSDLVKKLDDLKLLRISDSPTVSTARTDGTGVSEGRSGVKRRLTDTESVASSPTKKPSLDSPKEEGDRSSS